MNAALVDDKIVLSALSDTEYQIIRAWNAFRWDRQRKAMVGDAALETIRKVYDTFRVTNRDLAERYRELKRIEDAVNVERYAETPSDFGDYKVKNNLFIHQKRAINMAMLTFGYNPETRDFDEGGDAE